MQDMRADQRQYAAQCLLANHIGFNGGMEEQRPPRLLHPPRGRLGLVVLLPVRTAHTGYDAVGRRVSWICNTSDLTDTS